MHVSHQLCRKVDFWMHSSSGVYTGFVSTLWPFGTYRKPCRAAPEKLTSSAKANGDPEKKASPEP